MSYDVVIPLGPNDFEVIESQLEYTKRYVKCRNIYVIVNKNCKLNLNGVIRIDEELFPFSLDDVAKYHGKQSRNGWYLQQLIKLYVGFVIPEISEKYLVIDSDTYFLKSIDFINEEGKCLYNVGEEHHTPYFEHMKRLHPSLERVLDCSGICHHMMFEKKYIKELFNLVEDNHKGSNSQFWEIFLEQVDKKDILLSGASEYEIYFNFMLKYHPENIVIRKLKWLNSGRLFLNGGFDYVSVHHYWR